MTNPDKPENQGPERASSPGDVTAVYTGGGSGEELVRVLDQYLADLEAGRAPSREKLLAEHPALASQLEPCLSGMEFIHRAARPTVESPSRLGDFEIVAEVGRGGMGVVYEAQQLSLKRKVALKVLRFGGVADRDAMERFQREAETVAQLHHTNIVPIFAIGEQKGVFYYAMQFIEGRSLAAVLEQSQKEAAPLKLVESARWALQAAEALAHAHQRGVIHRDVKPSNLILDPAGQIWLTDFGLAKRLDDGTLSMTGALLGTPRYMSPEQASAAKQPVDQRTDIYSLGATLYELATGKPLFEADSPHGIISQILTTEPPSPRKVRAGLPRDLETIILKCLAKDPPSRYATAQALADDLRAFCEGRAIKARRAGIAERTVRWVQRRKKQVAIAAITAAATLAVAIVSFTSYHSFAASRLAHFQVAVVGNDEHFKVEVLDEPEHKSVATFTAPTQQSQEIPPGHYHVRLSKAGQLSETSQFEAAVGSSYSAMAAISSRNLWETQLGYGETAEVAKFDGRDDVFLAGQDGLRRLDGGTGQAIWQISVAAKDQPLVEKAFHGILGHWPLFNHNESGMGRASPALVRPTLDLDGDGTPDLIWASRSSAALLAISEKSGKLLWCHRCLAALPENIREKDVQSRAGTGANAGTIVGEPLLAEAGGKKIIAAISALGAEAVMVNNQGWVYGKPQIWLEAIDAETGATLWRRPLDWIAQASTSDVLYSATIWKREGRAIGVIACENRLIGFDMLTGAPAWPDREIAGERPLSIHFADLRGDGQLGLLMLREMPISADAADHLPNYGPRTGTEFLLTAISPLAQAPLWERRLKYVFNPLSCNSSQMSSDWDWPLLVDLDGKGKPKVAIPFVDYANHACGVELLDGATGETKWRTRLSTAVYNWRPPQPERMVLGPDLDGDGCREIFVASYDEENERMYVDALSGRDGRLLWSNQEFVLNRGQPGILPLRWWQPGADGWPLLVVSFGNSVYTGMTAQAKILAASTGRVEQEAADFGAPQVFDLNGDGLPDLLVSDVPMGRPHSNATKLRAIKGMPPAVWRVIGEQNLVPGQDLNRDGYADLLSPGDGRAISGRDAAKLWQSDAFRSAEVVSHPLPDADLNGDGIPDLLTMPNSSRTNRSLNVVATSGRDGSALWTAELLMTEDNTLSFTGLSASHMEGHILEAGKKPDVLVLYQRQRHPRSADNNAPTQQLLQTRLARLSGQNGHAAWDQAIGDFSECDIRNLKIPFALADLDGDGVKDIVFWLPMSKSEPPADEQMKKQATESTSGKTEQTVVTEKSAANDKVLPSPATPLFELIAISGRDGKLLWRRPGFFTTKTSWSGWLGDIPAPTICDPKADGHPLVLIADQCHEWLTADRLLKELHSTSGGGGADALYTEILALDGKNGEQRWSWRGEGVSLNTYNGPLESAQTWRDASPQVARTAAGPAIVVSGFDESLRTKLDSKTHYPTPTGKSGARIVVLNTRGEVLRKTDDRSPDPKANFVNFPPLRPQVWVHDLTADGQDTLVWCDGRRVRAMRPAAPEVLWESDELPMPLNWYIYGIQPAGKGYPATVAVGNSSGMIGLAGPTGKIRWRCDAEGVQPNSLLATDDPQGLPRIWTKAPGTLQTNYQAIATDDRGRYQMPQPAALHFDSSFSDHRNLRRLPWNRWPANNEDWSGTWIVVLIAILAIASIVGWWPGKMRRAVWLFALWLIPWLTIMVVRLWLDARDLGPGEHYDWSNFWNFSIQEARLLMGILGAIWQVWWLARIVRWIVKKIAARMRRPSAAAQ